MEFIRLYYALVRIKKKGVWLIFLGIISCSPSIEVKDFQINLGNALRARFLFSTERKTIAFIEFWKANDSIHFTSPRSLNKTEHNITLFNLKPLTTYHYIIKIAEDGITRLSPENTFITDTLPGILPELDLVIDEGDVFNGYLLIRNVQSPGQQLLINNNGQIIWYHEFDTTLFRPFSWTTNQTIIALRSDKEIHEVNLNGELVYNQKFGEKGFSHLLHHEIFRDSRRNIYSLTRNNQLFDLTSIGGGRADTVKGDGILMLDSLGNKLWEWDIFKYSDPLLDNKILETKDDWSHANSLSIAEDGHYLVSFRHFNQIWKINSNSGEILWKLGENGDFHLEKDQLFYLQHTAHINNSGELILFDNGGPERLTSRAVSFIIDPIHKMVTTGKVNVFLPPSLFSFKQGSAYLIEDDKVLFCSSIKKCIVISDLEGNIMWRLNLSESVYRANYIKDINWSTAIFP